MQMVLLLLVLIVIAMQAADIWTTHEILRLGGVEKNPVIAALMRRLGVLLTLVLTKGLLSAAVLGLAVLVRDLPQPDQELAVIALLLIVAGYWWVLANNLRAYREQKGRA